MFSMLRQKDGAFVDGCAKMFDNFEQAVDVLEDKSIDADSTLCLYWIWGENNVLVAAADRGLATWILEPAKLIKHGWYKGEWKCPLCNHQFGKNLKGEQPFLLVGQHIAQHNA